MNRALHAIGVKGSGMEERKIMLGSKMSTSMAASRMVAIFLIKFSHGSNKVSGVSFQHFLILASKPPL